MELFDFGHRFSGDEYARLGAVRSKRILAMWQEAIATRGQPPASHPIPQFVLDQMEADLASGALDRGEIVYDCSHCAAEMDGTNGHPASEAECPLRWEHCGMCLDWLGVN